MSKETKASGAKQPANGATYEANYGDATPKQVAAAVLRYRPGKQAAPPTTPEKRP